MASPQSLFTLLRDAVRHEQGLFKLVRKLAGVLLREGPSGIGLRVNHLKIQRGAPEPIVIDSGIDYQTWVDQEYESGDAERAAKLIEHFQRRPRISIVCPVYNPDPDHLRAAIASVVDQIYPDWELCLVDDASTVDFASVVESFDDERITLTRREKNGNISAASNTGIDASTGDFITFLDQDDCLSKFALFWVAELLDRQPALKLIYSDEDKISSTGARCDPNFKPDWNYTFQLANNYLCHLAVYEASLLRDVGGLRLGYEGSQDHDLTLRVIERIDEAEIAHIPRVLYHWRKHAGSTAMNLAAKPYTLETGRRAVQSHLERVGRNATVEIERVRYRVRFELPSPAPGVTIVIPTRDRGELLRNCIESVMDHSTYRDFRILVVDNGSTEPETLSYLEDLEGEVIRDDGAFNFSRLVNVATRACTTELVCLLNNDVEVINPGWLESMVRQFARSEVGIVGAKLYYPDDTIQHGGAILGIGSVAGHAHKYLAGRTAGYADRLVVDHELSAVTAACMLYRRNAWEAVKGFDEGLAVAFNDIDFCLRVRQAGYKIVWASEAELYHYESKTRGAEDTPEKRKRFEEERQVMAERWGDALTADPAYNPNLTLDTEDFAIASRPRTPTLDSLLNARVRSASA